MTKKILVIGFVFGYIFKISIYKKLPEINTPVSINKKKEFFLGGCGNVTANLRSFNEAVTLISFFSNNKHSYNLKKILKKKKLKLIFYIILIIKIFLKRVLK